MARFMLDTSSGPFMSALSAERSISMALTTYLCSSFTLIDTDVQEDTKILRVAQEYHSLHPYANEFWVSHFLAYVDLCPTLDSDLSDPVLDMVFTLCDTHDSFTPSEDDDLEPTPYDSVEGDGISALRRLRAHLDIQDFVSKILVFREKKREGQLSASVGKYIM